MEWLGKGNKRLATELEQQQAVFEGLRRSGKMEEEKRNKGIDRKEIRVEDSDRRSMMDEEERKEGSCYRVTIEGKERDDTVTLQYTYFPAPSPRSIFIKGLRSL